MFLDLAISPAFLRQKFLNVRIPCIPVHICGYVRCTTSIVLPRSRFSTLKSMGEGRSEMGDSQILYTGSLSCIAVCAPHVSASASVCYCVIFNKGYLAQNADSKQGSRQNVSNITQFCFSNLNLPECN